MFSEYTPIFYAKICLNGHINNSQSDKPANKSELCYCGAKLISYCPKCETKIPTPPWNGRVYLKPKYKLPSKCENCLENFPWEKAKKKQIFKQKFLFLPTFISSVFSKIFKS